MTIAAGYCCINVPHSLVDVQRTNPHKRQLRSFVCGNRQKKPCYSRSAYRAGSEYEHRALTKAHSLRRSACQAIHAAAQQPAGVEPTDDETARHAASQRLLNSLTDSEAPAIACRCVSPGAGLALVADRDIPPGAILLTVPMSVVLMTEDNDQVRISMPLFQCLLVNTLARRYAEKNKLKLSTTPSNRAYASCTPLGN